MNTTLRDIQKKSYRLIPERARKVLCSDLFKQENLSGYSVEKLLGIRLLATTLLPLAALLIFRFSAIGLLLAAPLAALGYLLPIFLAESGKKKFLDSVRSELPHTTDMLYTLVVGGKNLDNAFRGATECSPEPLRSLLIVAVRHLELGSSTEEAFELVREECHLRELSSLLRTISEAQKRGTPLSHALMVFSNNLREKERDRIRQSAAKAPLKMLAPLVFLILPASIILTIGPTIMVALNQIAP
ncbi:MAG: type II secretion system F family protein [Actinomycetota bacterium]|nr:type II secretion system F family protein [Actinomycetota bacterium]